MLIRDQCITGSWLSMAWCWPNLSGIRLVALLRSQMGIHPPHALVLFCSNEYNTLMEEAEVKANDIILKCCMRSHCAQTHAVISQSDSLNACAALCWWWLITSCWNYSSVVPKKGLIPGENYSLTIQFTSMTVAWLEQDHSEVRDLKNLQDLKDYC